jgi:adenine-specific DNA-methyltransferase
MMPRLKLLRELLRDDGVVFISIDDNEFNNLVSLCDEVFGEANRFGIIIIKNNPRGRRLGTELAVEHEYLIAYTRQIEKFKAGRLELSEEQLAEYSETDKEGRQCRLLGLRKRGALSKREDRPNLHYPIYINPNDASVHVEERKGLVKIIPKLSNGTYGVWRWSKEKVKRESHLLIAKQVKRRETGKTEWDVCQIDYPDNEEGELTGRLFPSIWQGSEFNNETGRDQIKDIFGEAIFEYPKPVDLIKHAVILSGDKDCLVLDSFAGSGTTGQAVLELNWSDSGNRKFILVECEDYADKITAERLRRVIKGVKTAKDEKQKKGLGGSFSFFELGDPIEMESILEGKKMPDYTELARYIFYTATGEEFNPDKVKRSKNFIGDTKDYEVYLYYEPDIEKLKKLAFTLEEAKKLGAYKGKKRLVFAPTKYLDLNDADLIERHGLKGIEYCQLPFEIYKMKG